MRRAGLVGILAMPVALFAMVDSADAVVEQIYTFPFYQTYNVSCAFHCYYDPVYGWHEGTDHQIGVPGVGGEYVVAAASGTTKTCPLDPRAGNYVVMDHGNGHRTRYLHLDGVDIHYGPTISVGQLIGYEGNTGASTGPHLHFETRHGAAAFTCGKDGTAVDPYAGGTYMWATNPPSYAEGETIGVSTWASNRLDVFVRGNNGQLYHRWWDGVGWNPINTWEGNHGGCLRGGPSAVSRTNPIRIDVFVRGCFDHLHRKSWTGTWADTSISVIASGQNRQPHRGVVAASMSSSAIAAIKSSGYIRRTMVRTGARRS